MRKEQRNVMIGQAYFICTLALLRAGLGYIIPVYSFVQMLADLFIFAAAFGIATQLGKEKTQ